MALEAEIKRLIYENRNQQNLFQQLDVRGEPVNLGPQATICSIAERKCAFLEGSWAER